MGSCTEARAELYMFMMNYTVTSCCKRPLNIIIPPVSPPKTVEIFNCSTVYVHTKISEECHAVRRTLKPRPCSIKSSPIMTVWNSIIIVVPMRILAQPQ